MGLGGTAVPTAHPRLAASAGRSSLVPSKYSMTAMIFIVMLSFYYFSRHVSALLSNPGKLHPQPLPLLLASSKAAGFVPSCEQYLQLFSKEAHPRKPFLSMTTSVQRTPPSCPHG